jgi:hypothetical protein
MRGGSGCHRADLCGPSCITMGWSSIISPLTLRGVLGDRVPLEVVAPPLQGGALFQEGG